MLYDKTLNCYDNKLVHVYNFNNGIVYLHCSQICMNTQHLLQMEDETSIHVT